MSEASYRPISADSHIAEPPHCWVDYIDPVWRDVAPHVARRDKGDDQYVIKGLPGVSLARITSAGWSLEQMRATKGTFEEVNKGGYDAAARLLDQDIDGVAAEVIYPSMGMLICGLPDIEYKDACFRAYNRWLAEEFCAGAPDRLYGIGCTAAKTVADTVDDLARFKEAGFKGAMMAPFPGTEEDFDHPNWDPVWRAAVELDLPISFHCLTSARDTEALAGKAIRGPKINGFQAIVRVCQDIIGMFIFGGVFDRNPQLKLVSVEADAGWAPHWMYRADHAYKIHRTWLTCSELQRLPSDYFHDNVYLTFQDDAVAFRSTDLLNPERLMWASDYPHADSTWPHSQDVLAEHAGKLDPVTRKAILRDNVVKLYSLEEHLTPA